jgi:chorismate dehydratase
MLEPRPKARCGRISYTNDLPVYAAFDLGALEFPGTLHEGVPTELNRALLAGELDISPISSFFYLQHQDELIALPHTCIGSRREVKSIYCISPRHPRELAETPIAITRESATGRALFEAICRGYYGFAPAYVEAEDPFAAYADARIPCLLIGDKAIDAALAVPPREAFDVGLLWHELSGKDMVYAVWAARNDIVDARPDDVARVGRALVDAVDWGAAHKDQVIARAQAIRPRPAGFYASYYRTLNYRFDEAARDGLGAFARLAGDLGLLPMPATHAGFTLVGEAVP